MTVDQAIQRAFLHAQRKPVAPAANSTKYMALLGIADSMQKLWASEPDVEWSSRYQRVSIGTISTTDTYDLDDSIQYISKREGDRVTVSSGTQSKAYTLVSPDELYQYRNSSVCAQIGRSLVFGRKFVTTDTVYGYTINIPSYTYTDDITKGANQVQVDDPMWLVYMMAAEFVRNDTVRLGQYNTILGIADQVMQKMKLANGGQISTVDTPWRPAGESWV